MSTPAHDLTSEPSVYTSSGRLAVPANAVELLRDSINRRRDGSGRTENIHKAAALICASARQAEASPEHVLVTVKELCHALPEYERIPGARERDAFIEVVVTAAIQEYYRV